MTDTALHEPDWFRQRKLAMDWDAAVAIATQERDRRDGVRGEMIADLLGLCDLLQRGGDWMLRDCETASQLIVRIADGVTRIRASAAREGAMQ
jgi:hypothetical protein